MLKINENIRFNDSLCASNGRKVEFLSANLVADGTEGYQPTIKRYRE